MGAETKISEWKTKVRIFSDMYTRKPSLFYPIFYHSYSYITDSYYQGRRNVSNIRGGGGGGRMSRGATMVGAEWEKFLILEPLDRQKWLSQSICKEKIFNQGKNIQLTLVCDSLFCVFTYFTYTFMFNSDFLGGPKDILAPLYSEY